MKTDWTKIGPYMVRMDSRQMREMMVADASRAMQAYHAHVAKIMRDMER